VENKRGGGCSPELTLEKKGTSDVGKTTGGDSTFRGETWIQVKKCEENVKKELNELHEQAGKLKRSSEGFCMKKGGARAKYGKENLPKKERSFYLPWGRNKIVQGSPNAPWSTKKIETGGASSKVKSRGKRKFADNKKKGSSRSQ